ncbi:MAG: FAD-dependent monooxygenase, partial [Nakamurella sp.]
EVTLRRTHGEFDEITGAYIDLDPTANVHARAGDENRVIRAKYVVGCDGARSGVRAAIGRSMDGDQSMHAWAVMDVLAVTDFPDIRTKCAINSEHGSILHIPREGGSLFRMYVDLGDLTDETEPGIRKTTRETAIATANKILHPYTLDVHDVVWYSVYEVAHRVTDKFDDVPFDREGDQLPRVFIAGDACHTHSAKAGQGMNVSMQDTFNLGWKLGAVLEGRSPESLLATYSAERQTIAQDLITFDKKWSAMMAKKPEDFEHAEDLGDYYLQTFEFPTGFMTQYQPSMLTGDAKYQHLAAGFPIGKRFRSEITTRVADVNTIHLGHHMRADGRWRLYAFADSDRTALDRWAASLADSVLARFTPAGADLDTVFDLKVIYQQQHADIELPTVPQIFLPRVGPFQLIDYEKVYATHADTDIFATRDIDRGGCVVVVRPDQYVAHVLPLTATDELAEFFSHNMLDQAN